MTTKCPSERRLRAAVGGRLSARKRARLTDHIFVCAECRRTYDILSRIRASVQPLVDKLDAAGLDPRAISGIREPARGTISGPVPPTSPRPVRPSPAAFVLRSAVLVLMIAFTTGAALWLWKGLNPDHALRADGKQSIRLIEPIGTLSGPPAVFSWTKLDGAEDYRMKIASEDLTTICIKRLSANRFVLPADIQSRLLKKKTYIWSVEAFDAEENKIGEDKSYFVFE